MAETTTYQCPNCDGRLQYNGELGKLQCEFCESTFTAQEVERIYAARQAKADAKAAGDRQQQVAPSPAAAPPTSAPSAAQASTSEAAKVQVRQTPLTGDPVQDYLAQAKWDSSETDGLRAFNCSSCGAQLMVDQVTAVTSCPYCGNNAVVPGQLSDILKPDFIIPFKLDHAAAVAELKRYYNGKRFLPNGFTEGNHIEEIQGVYVPFWLYSGTGESNITFNGRNIRAWSDSRNNYVETDHFLLHRTGTMDYQHVPADGSTKMPDAHMDAIEPFDYSEMVPFSVGYLPGYLTDRYDLDVSQCDSRARGRVESTCVDSIQQTITGYAEVDVASANTSVTWSNVAYALLPVWMLHTQWNGQDYLFAMNGQTGRFVGDLPIDNGKVVRRALLIFFPLAIVLFVIVYFTLGFGI